MNRCTQTREVWYNETAWTYLQVLYQELFSLKQLLNTAMVGISNF
jgi:hypothetical protein